MAGFKLTCGNCGSESVLIKSGHKLLDYIADRPKYGEGIQRKCLDCANEEFIIFKTGLRMDDSCLPPVNPGSQGKTQGDGSFVSKSS
jgi:hypothetical protein